MPPLLSSRVKVTRLPFNLTKHVIFNNYDITTTRLLTPSAFTTRIRIIITRAISSSPLDDQFHHCPCKLSRLTQSEGSQIPSKMANKSIDLNLHVSVGKLEPIQSGLESGPRACLPINTARVSSSTIGLSSRVIPESLRQSPESLRQSPEPSRNNEQ